MGIVKNKKEPPSRTTLHKLFSIVLSHNFLHCRTVVADISHDIDSNWQSSQVEYALAGACHLLSRCGVNNDLEILAAEVELTAALLYQLDVRIVVYRCSRASRESEREVVEQHAVVRS